MQWNVDILANPVAPADFLIAAIYDASAPDVLVDLITLPKPYTGTSKQITFLNVDPIVYNFKLWENAEADVADGLIRNTFSFQPTTSTIFTRGDLYLTAGNTPEDPQPGQTQYLNDSLQGWQYDIERVGQGTMFPNIAYEVDNDVDIPLFGWHLIAPGDIFTENERYVMRFLPQVGSTSISAVVNSAFSGAKIVTADDALVSDDSNKTIIIRGAGNSLNLALPPLASVQDFKMFSIHSRGGSHLCANVVPDGSDMIDWITATVITLIQLEQLKIYKYDGKWNVDYLSPTSYLVGEQVFSYGPINGTILALGQLVSRTDYARLWAYAQAAGVVVSDAAWNNTATGVNGILYNTNHGKYSSGTDSTNFRLPNLTELGFIKAVSGTGLNTPGRLEAGQVGAFNLTLPNMPVFPKAGNSNQIVAVGNVNDGILSTRNVNVGIVNNGIENTTSNIGLLGLIRY